MSKNVDVLRDAYRKWHESKGGSIDHWLPIFAERVAFGSLAQGRPQAEFAAPRSTRAEIRGYLEGLTRDWAMIHYTPEFFVEQGDRVAMFGSTKWRNKRTGKEVETPKADFWRFEDGEAVQFYELFDTAALVEAATP